MVFAVAEIALAPGTIAEFQFRICEICPAADRAAVVVGPIRRGSLISTGAGEGDYFCFLRFLSEKPPYLCLGRQGNKTKDVVAHKQEIISESHQGEQVVGEIHNRIA